VVDIIDFPASLRITDRDDPFLVPNVRSGGVAMDGGEQVISPLTNRWRWRIVIPIRNKADARAYRTLILRLNGRYNYLRVPTCDRYRLSRKDVGATYPGDAVPFSDDSTFSDGSGFALAQPSAAVTAAGAAGDGTLTVDAAAFAGAITAGVFFAVNDWLYAITDWSDDGSGNYVLTISPTLREAVTTADVADFRAPAIWALAADDSGIVSLRGGRLGEAVLDLIEPLGRRIVAA
jgi:hypothetical protein